MLAPKSKKSSSSKQSSTNHGQTLPTKSSSPRMKQFFDIMQLPVPPKLELKEEAKKIKSFLVLLKQKLTRQQVCRSKNFRRLMALVFDPDEQEKGSPTFSVR